jgi:hypothetical protein
MGATLAASRVAEKTCVNVGTSISPVDRLPAVPDVAASFPSIVDLRP